MQKIASDSSDPHEMIKVNTAMFGSRQDDYFKMDDRNIDENYNEAKHINSTVNEEDEDSDSELNEESEEEQSEDDISRKDPIKRQPNMKNQQTPDKEVNLAH